MDIETWIAFLTLFGGREIVSFLLNRRKSQADVRATDAGAAGEIADAAGAVVKLLRTQVEALRQQLSDLKIDHEDLFEKFKDAEAFKAILEAQMKHVNDMRADLEDIVNAVRAEAFKLAKEVDEIRERLTKCHEAMLEVKELRDNVRRLSEHIVDLQDENTGLGKEIKILEAQMNGRPDTTKSAN